MPEMDGLQFMDEARKDIRGLRFGLITAAATESVRARARAAGAAFVLAKPFSPIQLQTALLRFGLKPGAEVAFDMVHEVASQVTSRRAGLSASGLQRSLNTLFQVDVRVTGTDKLNVRARFRNVVCAYRDPQGEIVAATVIDWTLAPRLATALSLIHKNVAEDVIATSTLPPHLAENLYEVCNVLGHVVGDGQELTAQPLDVKPQRPDREVIRLARAKRLDVTVRLAGSGSGPMAILTSG
jgi:hypothetical protein